MSAANRTVRFDGKQVVRLLGLIVRGHDKNTKTCGPTIVRDMNITFSLDDSLVSAAKVVAARHDTSISALVRTSLEHQVALDSETASSGASGVLQELIDYSMGRRPRAVTMEALGIDDYGVLLRLLNAAHLPHPLVPLARRQAMAAGMAKALRAHTGTA